jgi:hypothetical protein
MSIRGGLVAARGHIVFLVALVTSSIAILFIEDQLTAPVSLKPQALAEAPSAGGTVLLDLGIVSTAQNAAALWEQSRANVPEVAALPLLMRDAGAGISVAIGPVPDGARTEVACQHLVEIGVACQLVPYVPGQAKS